MVVRLGNPPSLSQAAPFYSAAADLIAESGRAIGRGYENLGAGFAHAGQEVAAGKIRREHRQDVLDQQAFEREMSQKHLDIATLPFMEKVRNDAMLDLQIAQTTGDPSKVAEATKRVQDANNASMTVVSRVRSSGHT